MPKNKELPVNKVRVVGHNIDLLIKNPDDDTYLDDSRGYWDSVRERIILNRGGSNQKNKEVVLHELLHCIESVLSIELTEETVCGVSRILFSILQDNPKLSSWLISPGDSK